MKWSSCSARLENSSHGAWQFTHIQTKEWLCYLCYQAREQRSFLVFPVIADPPLLLIIPVLSHASVAVVITEKGKEPRLVVHNLSHLEKSVSNYADGEILFHTTLEKEAVADPAAG